MKRHLLRIETLLVLLPLALAWALLSRLGRWFEPAHPEIVGKTDSFRFPGAGQREAPAAAALPVVLTDLLPPVPASPRPAASPRTPRPRRPRAKARAAA